ncbi:MAG: hypothetical protein WDO73_15150 [Ignavibacteriota bacterium]
MQWLMNEIAIRITHAHLYKYSAEIAAGEAVLFSAILLYRLFKQQERPVLAIFWILTLGLIVFTWRAFTANSLEFVHYPQYLPEGMILVALTLSPVESLAWVVILGGLDEAYQYTALNWFRPAPYDFNDIYMDLLGGALGVLFGMVFLRCTRRDQPGPPLWKRPGIVAIFGILATGVILWASGLMLLFENKADTLHWFALSRFHAPTFWFQVAANGPNKYHTLSPVEGPLLILATLAVYAILDLRVRISAK